MDGRPETLSDILTEMREREVARGFKSKTLSEWAARIEAVTAPARVAWRPMATAPRDGTILRLLVRFTEHPLDDASEADLVPTIGENNRDNTGEDVWQFAGWCWTHDHFTEGQGTPVGWLPMLSDLPPSLAEVEPGEPLFYIQDTRSFVGNCPLWWCPEGKGYTTSLDLAGKFPRDAAMRQQAVRNTDRAWPCAQIDAIRRPTVDMQDMRAMTPEVERSVDPAR